MDSNSIHRDEESAMAKKNTYTNSTAKSNTRAPLSNSAAQPAPKPGNPGGAPAFVSKPLTPVTPQFVSRPASPSPMAAPTIAGGGKATREQIAKRAYEIWIAKGRPVGRDIENWQQAERELLGQK
jgi:hypothetical protein